MEVQAVEYTCDSCSKSTIVLPHDDVEGLGGEVFEVTRGGGRGVEWWACSRKCVSKAVANALDKRDD